MFLRRHGGWPEEHGGQVLRAGGPGLVGRASALEEGDLACIMAGPAEKTRKLNEPASCALHLGDLLPARPEGLRCHGMVDFPAAGTGRGGWPLACHAPPLHRSGSPEDADRLESDPGSVKANAYDLVINGTEIGGGGIRIHDRTLQERMFRVLGFSDVEAREKFGFPDGRLRVRRRLPTAAAPSASEAGALGTPHGHPRVLSPSRKNNNAGRDVIDDARLPIEGEQLHELGWRWEGRRRPRAGRPTFGPHPPAHEHLRQFINPGAVRRLLT